MLDLASVLSSSHTIYGLYLKARDSVMRFLHNAFIHTPAVRCHNPSLPRYRPRDGRRTHHEGTSLQDRTLDYLLFDSPTRCRYPVSGYEPSSSCSSSAVHSGGNHGRFAILFCVCDHRGSGSCGCDKSRMCSTSG